MNLLLRRGAMAMGIALSLAANAEQLKQSAPAAAQVPQVSAIDPKADKVLKDMGAALAAAKTVSFSAHAISDQFTPEGQKIQVAKNQKVVLARPNKLAAEVVGDVEDLVFRYDGKKVTLFNPRTNSWGTTDAPATIDDTLDMLADKYQMPLPLADLVFADPYTCLTENVGKGEYIGVGYVFETKCHHLAFRQAAVDWQIWIEDKAGGMPRKVVITFKEAPGHPQYTAFLSDWNLAAAATDATFAFTAPAGAKKVEFSAPADLKEQK